MAVQIGKKIKQVFDKKGMSVSELSRRLNSSRENVYDIFKRRTIDTELLTRISKALEHDFFQYYTPLREENQRLKEENSFLKELLRTKKSKQKEKE